MTTRCSRWSTCIYVYTFQVTGTSISNGTLDLIYDSYPVSLGSVKLSEDGTTVYFTLGLAGAKWLGTDHGHQR